jgi:hypothetical protein
VTLTCDGDVEFYANVGDTIIFSLAAPCDPSTDNNDGIYNVQDPGTGSVEGFLDPNGSSETQNDYWWRYAPDFPLSTTLMGTTGAGVYTLSPGATVAAVMIANDFGSYAIRWMGPTSTEGAGSVEDLTIWHQSYARSSQAETCVIGFTPSWAEWPNGGDGGWVCDRASYAYYPERAVTQ